MNTRAAHKSRYCVVLASAAALALLATGCADGPAGGAHPVAANTPGTVAGTGASSTQAAVAPSPSAATLSPRVQPPIVLASNKNPAAAGPVRDITFDTIKFPMEKKDPFKRSLITPRIEELAGQKIRLRGYILPTSKQRVSFFILVRDNKECCFGPNAALYDCVAVNMEPGQMAEYSLWPVTVEGVFDVRIMEGPDERPAAIYHLQATSVK